MIMGEHADFIAHLLDPEERTLIMKAMQTADTFRQMHNNLPPSKDPLCRVFRSKTGMSPVQYLKCLRMEKARYLLQSSSLTVREISSRVGIPDDSHFVRDFKKAYGATPTTYRTKFVALRAQKSRRSTAKPAKPNAK
jgi:transcriptional regulator GlxA family with amidase domain